MDIIEYKNLRWEREASCKNPILSLWKLVGSLLSFCYSVFGLVIIIVLCALALIVSVLFVTCAILFSMISFLLPHLLKCSTCIGEKKLVHSIWFILVRLGAIVGIFFLNGMILMLGLSIVAGVTLNAEYFNPFLAPILTLVVYFWKNWKFSVEAECLQLKTSIIELCKEKAPKGKKRTITTICGKTTF
jgi:hypothetical protein